MTAKPPLDALVTENDPANRWRSLIRGGLLRPGAGLEQALVGCKADLLSADYNWHCLAPRHVCRSAMPTSPLKDEIRSPMAGPGPSRRPAVVGSCPRTTGLRLA